MSYSKEITVNVTQEHIDNGVPKMCSRCPIALAVKELFLEHEVAVSSREIAIRHMATNGKNPWVYYTTPLEAGVFITQFDSADFGEPLPQPFSFTATRIYPMQDSEA